MYAKAIHVDIGYCLTEETAGFAFEPPRAVIDGRTKPMGMRAIQNCPAVNSIERQLVEIYAPIGLRLGLATQGGQLGLKINPQGTFAKQEILQKMLVVEPPERWRDKKKPVLQINLPFFFVTDEPCWCAILPPFLSPNMRRWPGTMVAGRYPVSDWPQDLQWGIEWDALEDELVIRQGDVLAYAMFQFDHPDKRPRMVEAEMTDDLTEFRAGMDGVSQISPEIEEIWARARERRPAQLLHTMGDAA